MDYLFENLGDKRFQEFCASLIAKIFPNSQSFPVGQPDGGRDSISYILDSAKKEFIVFQVKYVRNPQSITDVHKWLTEIIKKEAPKVSNLILSGAKTYYLLTNVKGTAHLDTGSIDQVNKIFEEKISIPSICWWRDDLSRIIEGDPMFLWSFPEIISGKDILNSTVFHGINEQRERKEMIIKAYLADQYAIDNEVKFRQIDLQNKLMDLFTDVPIKIKKYNERDKHLKKIIDQFDQNSLKEFLLDDNFQIDEKETNGAASFLLHPIVQAHIERILLEGGPGQGKSTISQYICQVHRAKLLHKQSDIDQLPKAIKQCPLRLPFKLDLRHIAGWIEGKNPYVSRLSDDVFSVMRRNSLESFLTGHIMYHSQSDTFSTDDLLSILRNSSVLIVFDGFDEIADLKIRGDVIDFINRGINRLKENAKSLQIVITSRPAAFSDSIGFSVDMYPHFQLTEITPSITKEYVEKWVKVNRLDSRESAEIKRLVDEKLKMPHLRDLAKSPMQLAIFISLLRTRGESLPNKRTALYDSYIELFFNRESEKNRTIRDHRDLIIDIHQYLAWLLHSEAEMYGNSGSITVEELKKRLNEYLVKEGHQTNITDQLFHVLEVRVCALVSRIQGTYEFEVQPLREYFCAKYLYNTSPYSPSGKEKPGTKPERFNAIARNFYWQNVVRFFAGCFDKGELPMLIQELKNLLNDENLKYTNYPQTLTSQILSDWVFKQYPILLSEVVKIIVDGINIGRILNQDSRFVNSEAIVLPLECGRNEVFSECFEQLKKLPKNDYALDLIGILKNNPINTETIWLREANELKKEQLVRWFEYGYHLQIFHRIDGDELLKLATLDSVEFQDRKLQLLIYSNRLELLTSTLNHKTNLLDRILKGKLVLHFRGKLESSLHFLSTLIQPYMLVNIVQNNSSTIPLLHFIFHRARRYDPENITVDFNVGDEIDSTIKDIFIHLNKILTQPITDWQKSVSNWDILVEKLRASYGDMWAINLVALISSGIKSKDEKFDDYSALWNNELSLCKRMRHARMKSGIPSFWEFQISQSINEKLVLLAFFAWATPKTIIKLFELVDEKVNLLSEKELIEIYRSLKVISGLNTFTNSQAMELINFMSLKKHGDTTKLLTSCRLSSKHSSKVVYEKVDNIKPELQETVNEIKIEYLISEFLSKENMEYLTEIKSLYEKTNKYTFEEYSFYRLQYDNSYPLQERVAREIMADAKNYPRIIASIAERTCHKIANKKLKPVGNIAKEQNWFN
jgi:hypothetical protein